MKRREDPAPAETPPVDRAKVRALLGEANAARERGEIMHHHPAGEALGDLVGIMGGYVFICYPDDYRLTDAELDELADGLVRGSR